jgi:LCP family protein required for cell wall assembly
VLAVPRDLLVFIAPQALGRLGPTLNDGAQVLVDSICRTLGVGVDHLATVDFLSFAHLVDMVGGVDVTLPYAERDTVLHFAYDAGEHHLDGQDALTYVRVRHLEQLRDGTWQPDPDAGLGRNTRAREVLSQIGADAPDPSDPFGFARFAWASAGALSIDEESGPGAVRGMDDALRSVGDARELELPVTFRDGVVPVAKLLPEAVPVLRRFQPPARNGRCADPQLPTVDGQVLHPNR